MMKGFENMTKIMSLKSVQKAFICFALVGSLFATEAFVGHYIVSASTKAPVSNIKNINTVINKTKQKFPQSSVLKSGKALVPMKSVFEKFGYKITSDSKKGTVTATKSKSKIVVTLNKNTAVVNGKTVKMSANAQTINKTTMVALDFAGSALGVTAKYDSKTNTASLTSKTVVKTPSSTKQVVNGITVNYGRHTYEVKSQAEYNKVMEIVNKAVKDNKAKSFESLNEFNIYFTEYLNGARWNGNVDDLENDERQLALYALDSKLGELVQVGVKKETIMNAYRAYKVSNTLLEVAKTVDDGKPRSAYDALVGKLTDCDADGNTYSAVFDALGFNTSMLARTGHSFMIVLIGNKWYDPSNGGFAEIDFNFYKSEGYRVYTQPQTGSIKM
ncbi:copper amine oxidase N-terminal domain-containing protein [Neobacillus sp. D3-1R]|uniref:copper amine oxidase N-terminal domain-containing protein n=1 Tax=Neobacillus sp. D3-1R TaxID=3445778 RepID=UPI003F9FA918